MVVHAHVDLLDAGDGLEGVGEVDHVEVAFGGVDDKGEGGLVVFRGAGDVEDFVLEVGVNPVLGVGLAVVGGDEVDAEAIEGALTFATGQVFQATKDGECDEDDAGDAPGECGVTAGGEHADAGRNPETGGCGYATDVGTFAEYGTAADEADTSHNLCGNAAGVVGDGAAPRSGDAHGADGDQGEYSGAYGNKNMGAESGGVLVKLAFGPDNSPQNKGVEKSYEGIGKN